MSTSFEEQYALGPFGDALSGAVGGVISNAAVYPLDTVKTRIQANTKTAKLIKGKGAEKFINEFKAIIKTQGIQGLYRGLNASLTNSFVMQFAYFYWYAIVRNGYSKWRFPDQTNPQLSTAAELSLGALAGAISQLFVTPVGVVATRQQLSNKDMSVTDTIKLILKEDGITGLWRGLKPSLVLVINPAITYGVYERLKTIVVGNNSKITPFQSFLLGALSKSLATVVTYPYIMAKVRLQARYDDDDDDDDVDNKGKIESSSSSSSEKSLKKHKHKERYSNSFDVLRQVAKSDGIKGWYQGMGAQIFKAVLSQALLFGLKDVIGEYVLRFLLVISKFAKTPIGIIRVK